MITFNTGELTTLLSDTRPFEFQLIEREPMLFQCSTEFARRASGPITHRILDHLYMLLSTKDFSTLRVDTRSHMLMPGWYPCIPGWHCDFKRSEGGVQIPHADDALVKHYMYLSGGPETEFLENRNIQLNPEQLTWRAVDRLLGSFALDELTPRKCPTGTLVQFDANELHRGTPWRGSPGHWRYFFRATLFPPNRDESKVYANKIRHQAQVYCDIHEGW